MLNSAGDAAGNVNLRTDGFTGLTDLMRVVDPTRINSGAGGADDSAECVRQVLDGLKALRTADTTTAGDDDLSAFKVNQFTGDFLDDLKKLGADSFRSNVDVLFDDFGCASLVSLGFLKYAGANSAYLGTIVRP